MPLRTLRYATRVWDWWVRDRPRAHGLPAVIPIVVHQGSRPWRGERRLSSLVDAPDELMALLRPHHPELEVLVLDLAERSDADLSRIDEPLARVTLALLKARAELAPPERALVRHQDAWARVFADPSLADERHALVGYVLGAWDLTRREWSK